MLASERFRSAGILLHDETFVRWTLPELVGWANEGLKAIVLVKPSAKSTSIVLSLAIGTLQRLPTAVLVTDPVYLALLRLVRNLKTTAETPRVGARIIRPTTRDLLDASTPNWQDQIFTPYKAEVRQFVFDEVNPREYYVYPGNNGAGIVEAVVSRLPNAIDVETIGADPLLLASYDVAVDIDDLYAGPLLDYIAFRAYSKDESYAGNAGRAQFHYQKFAEALGVKIQVESATSPNARVGITAT